MYLNGQSRQNVSSISCTEIVSYCFQLFPKCPKCPTCLLCTYYNCPKMSQIASKLSSKCPMCPNCLSCTRSVPKCPILSQSVSKCFKMSQMSLMLKDVPECPNFYKNVFPFCYREHFSFFFLSTFLTCHQVFEIFISSCMEFELQSALYHQIRQQWQQQQQQVVA